MTMRLPCAGYLSNEDDLTGWFLASLLTKCVLKSQELSDMSVLVFLAPPLDINPPSHLLPRRCLKTSHETSEMRISESLAPLLVFLRDTPPNLPRPLRRMRYHVSTGIAAVSTLEGGGGGGR